MERVGADWKQYLDSGTDRWWREGVFYHVYVRSFADSNGDGIGDLAGLTRHLDHLSWLGIDGVWLSPTTPSPNKDWGYDVSDYCGVDPDLGTPEDLDRLVTAAHERGIRVLLDLVPNHTSDQHPWFLDARSSRGASHRDWYVWAGPAPDGGPPNNWIAAFGGPAWELDPATGQHYLHRFDAGQPDLNWWNPAVRDAFEDILLYWFERGIDGFRIDVANGIVKDRELRDNPPATDQDPPFMRLRGQRAVYDTDRPEVHEILQRWRRLADEAQPRRLLVGECFVFDLAALARFHGAGDELHLGFNFPFFFAPFSASALATVVAATETALPIEAWPVYAASNHDGGRLATRWCDGDENKVRCALLALLTLRGTPFLYYGDEIGLPDVPIPPGRVLDPVGRAGRPTRDRCRTPMQWSAEPQGGFTLPGVEPWLPLGDYKARNVAAQRAVPSSTLTFVRDAIALRRGLADLRLAPYSPIETGPDTWAWRRGEMVTVALNLSPTGSEVAGIEGSLCLTTTRHREGEEIRGTLQLGPFEGAVVVG